MLDGAGRKLLDLSGKRFGNLCVVERERLVPRSFEKPKHNSYWLWRCICSCGAEVIAQTAHLRRGMIKRCEICSSKNRTEQIRIIGQRTKNPKAGMVGLYHRYAGDARKRNLLFDLTKAQFEDLTSRNCHYCGAPPSNVSKSWNQKYIYNGIDRVDSLKGYFPANCVPCCDICNRAKSDLTLEEFTRWMQRLKNKSF